MTITLRTTVVWAIALCALGALAGFWWARRMEHAPATATSSGSDASRRALYWYDPMVPAQHFEQPGKSPFMDMQLVPRYADDGSAEQSGIRIDPRLSQNLGIRVVAVERRAISRSVEIPGTVVFNGRETAIVQAKAAGFVARVYALAPGDLVKRDAPIVDLVMPEWAAAQAEFLSLLGNGDAALIAAARARLLLLGMTPAFIAQLEASRQAKTGITVAAPMAGVLDTLEIRAGMTVSAGAPLASIKGVDPIWIEAALPEAATSLAGTGQSVSVQTAAFPGHDFAGRIIAVLPQANADTHTLRIRIELGNHNGLWKPGMFARVRLTDSTQRKVLLVPSEAVIHTGTRDLVILAQPDHRFMPVVVRVGEQYQDDTGIVAGLQEGQQVVASGQFLIDSEASLRGVEARMGSAHGDSP